MTDEIYDRDYQAARTELNLRIAAKLAQLAEAVRQSFAVLHRIEWQAPWTAQRRRVHER